VCRAAITASGFFAIKVRKARADASGAAATFPVFNRIDAETKGIREFSLRHRSSENVSIGRLLS
jgi:hypothetical protein